MEKALVWFRRDLRLHDHTALSRALSSATQVHLIFIFDRHILDQLETKSDYRVQFIHDSLIELEHTLHKINCSFEIRYGLPEEEIIDYCLTHDITDVFCNRDYEPYAKKRDQKVQGLLHQKHIKFHQFKDSVIFEARETLKDDGTPYRVFTPYMRRWRNLLSEQAEEVAVFPCSLKNIVKRDNTNSLLKLDWIKKIGFRPTPPHFKAGTKQALKQLDQFQQIIHDYTKLRDYPAAEATSNMSVYIRHGNISVRDLVRTAKSGSSIGHDTWLSEVIWREFYQYILDQFPQVEHHAFKPQYDQIKWRGGLKELTAWQDGETGYPLIDAAMRCLKATGTMPNRLRMVTASFLCKTLLVDWRQGEKWFASKLLDFDLASNNGGWQWCASSGVDAQPYFRIFNPWSQSKKFDPDGEFIRCWCPELSNFSSGQIHIPNQVPPLEQHMAGCLIGSDYPNPIVDYAKKRQQALEMYKQAVKT